MIHPRISSSCSRLPRLVSALLLLTGALAVLGLVGRAAPPADAGGAPAAGPGALDRDFGAAGRFFIPADPGIHQQGLALALQRDGKIVVAGFAGSVEDDLLDLTLWRLTPEGALDPDFNGTGSATLVLPGYQEGRAVAIDSLGRIVVVGLSSLPYQLEILVARFRPNGTLDPSFNGTGYLTRDFGPSTRAAAYGVAVQRDGKIVVAGATRETVGVGGNKFALARFHPDGLPDLNFGGGDGWVSTDFGGDRDDMASAVALRKDGRIVLAGNTESPAGSDFALARYLPDGSLDLSFDGDGRVTTDFGSAEFAKAVAIQPDGRIVVAGGTLFAGAADFALARYRKNGSLDSSFHQDGKATNDFGLSSWDHATGLALQKDGRLVVVGTAFDGTKYSFGLARYRKNGSLDPNFGNHGVLFSSISPTYDDASSVAVQRDGKIVVAGNADSTVAVARYLAR